jgi:hypothetical protein
MSEVYSMASRLHLANFAQDPSQLPSIPAVRAMLVDVEDWEAFGTPVLILKGGSDTATLLIALATTDAHFLRDKAAAVKEREQTAAAAAAAVGEAASRGIKDVSTNDQQPHASKQRDAELQRLQAINSRHIFQSDPKMLNALYEDHTLGTPDAPPRTGAGLRILRRVLERAVVSYLNGTSDCRFAGGPTKAATLCIEATNAAWAYGLQRENAGPAQLLESWVNVAKKGTVRVFRQKLTLEDAIGSHACSLEAVTNSIPLGSSLSYQLTL